MKRIILLLILIVVGLSACSAVPQGGYGAGDAAAQIAPYEADEYDAEYPDEEYETGEEYEEEVLTSFEDDALIFIEFVERAHPIFVIPEMLSEDYYDIREEFIRAAQEAENQGDFNFAIQRFIRVLRDGHMTLFGFSMLSADFIDTPLIGRDNRLFLLDEGIAGSEVVEIGGIPTQTVLNFIDEYFYYENEATRNQTHAIMSRGVQLLQRAGAEIAQGTVALTLFDGSETYEIHPMAVEANGWHLRGVPQVDYIINYGMITDDVFLIDLRAFIIDPEIARAEDAIRQAIDDGVRNFIFDVRNNGGGNSDVGMRLLRAMGVTPPGFGSVTRVRSALNPDQPDTASRIPGSTIATRNPNEVTIAVLTNVNTFSSARWVSTWVQDGGLGVIIGEPGANSPTAFGNMTTRITLPHSDMQMPSSANLWLRPDADADQNTVWPDIYVPSHEAMEAALEFFVNR
ncbi:MAG: S41 family peptidase [Defluviitaleaceae bacterium]|nr:S41 family peptidase [Defluviitaleaceae bacterium]